MKWFSILTLACTLWCAIATNEEGLALLALRSSLHDKNHVLDSWDQNLVSPCFSWSNVDCDGNDRVVSVNLPSFGFSGTLSPQIGKLKYLNTLALQGNHLSGSIPEELGELKSLLNLNLEGNNFSGHIPNSLGQLQNLQYLDLSNNNLVGEVPPSIASIRSLVVLDLSSNGLTGTIPQTILTKVSKYNFTDTRLSCGSQLFPCVSEDSSKSGSKSKVKVLSLSIGVPLFLLLICISLACKGFWWRYRQEVFVDVSGEDDNKLAFGQLKRFSWRELQLATDNFSEKNLLGQGGFGKVYKGILGGNTKIAVKRLTDYHSPCGEAAFLREIEMISVAVHRNLLRLIGFCVVSSERLLVYPFMENLSVAYRLRELKPGEKGLDWPTRKQVAIGAARGLEYLHEYCNPKIIHRDLKAANILLDDDFQAVVGDFGLAKVVDVKRTHITTQVRGTMGHIAPEYLSTGKSSEKTDVFGYGIMLLELITGQRAIDFSRLEEEDEVLLLDHVKKLHRERRLDAIVDTNLGYNYNPEEVQAIVQVALLCSQSSPEDRPRMTEVVRMLEGEGLAERWEVWHEQEAIRNREYEMAARRFDWSQDTTCNQEAIQLSSAR